MTVGAVAAPSGRVTAAGTTLRPGRPEDAEEAGRICYEAFRALATAHNFPPDFPSAEIAAGLLSDLLAHPGFYSVVAEQHGCIVGTNFVDERSTIAGVGPVTVDPEVQDSGVGTLLMLDVIERARATGFAGTRLLQAAYHNRSLGLYGKLGFDVQEVVVTLQGPPVGEEVHGFNVRLASEDDLEDMSRVCRAVHGHDRAGEVVDAIRQGSAAVVVHDGVIIGYTTGVAYFGHSVAISNHGLAALILAAPEFGGPGFLLPVSNGELFRWALAQGFRVVQVMTLMTLGLYHQPRGAYLPSILY
ncbi:MAG: GNAT family N-acetyltransferase [Actinomycetota bacterium]|nr:GNAT family N-acetyltransferase [Actinomycetota bacterium]